jgi:nucleotide-binding universal stress UspA family protein
MTLQRRAIVVGVDYSDQSIPALNEALLIGASGAAAGACTVLIPVLVLPEEPAADLRDPSPELRARLIRARANLHRLVIARANSLGLKVPRTEPKVRFGAPAAGILAEAREQGADLVAVGTHGRRGLPHLLLGSVAEEVSRQAPCSVLVARGAASPTVFDADEHLPLDVGAIEGTKDEVDQVTRTDPDSAEVLGEPHIEAGRIVLHVLDTATGQTFVCWFENTETVRVEPLEREWVPHTSPAARARAIRAALAGVARAPDMFAALFAELAERQT